MTSVEIVVVALCVAWLVASFVRRFRAAGDAIDKLMADLGDTDGADPTERGIS